MVRARWWMAMIGVTVSCTLVACTTSSSPDGDEGSPTVTDSSSTTGVTVTTTSMPPSSTSTTAVTTTTGDSGNPPTSTTTTSIPVEAVPGPIAGSVWAVVGVSFDDHLNVRSGPGVGSAIAGVLEPTAARVVVAGDAVAVGSSVWWRVAAGALDGWVNAYYLGALGDTDDVASLVVDVVGDLPSAGSMGELAVIVTRALSEGTVTTRTVVVAPADDVSDIGEITVDVFVDGDDAIRGERLLVFGQRIVPGGDYSLYAVESTPICWRGVDAAGLCV